MKTFLGVFRYEYKMSIRRPGLWIAYGILSALYLSSLLVPPDLFGKIPGTGEILSFAGTSAFMLNLFMPVVGGILSADRLVRDQMTGMEELLRSTAMNPWTYLLGKYLGSLLSVITPVVLTSFLIGIKQVIFGTSPAILPALFMAFIGINLPAYLLVVAFSLACPLVMPVRVYQVLFTGYWFWGNFLSPSVMPTLNGTYLTANGIYVLTAFFSGFFGGGGPDSAPPPNEVGALTNLFALAALALLALVVAHRYLGFWARRA